MDKKQIYRDLSQLLDEIDQLPLEDGERRRLHQLVGDIEVHVDAPEQREGGDELADTVDEFIARLETDHPGFTGVLRRVLNALSSMGV